MNQRTARILRVLTFAAFAAVVALAVIKLRPEPGGDKAVELQRGELGVAEAISRAPLDPVQVRGFVFAGPGGLRLRLCEALRRGDPPSCIGPFLELDGVDEGSFGLESGGEGDERVRFLDESVALAGTVRGAEIQVTSILQ